MRNFIVISITILFILSIYLGFINFHKPQIVTIRKMKFIYFEVQKDYNSLHSDFMKLNEIYEDLSLSKDFQKSGFYFDNLNQLKDQTKARSAIGFILNEESNKDKINELIKLDFKLIELPEIKAGRLINLSNLNVAFIMMGSIIQKIYNFLKNKSINLKNSIGFVIYYGNEMEINLLFGKNIESFNFSKFKWD